MPASAIWPQDAFRSAAAIFSVAPGVDERRDVAREDEQGPAHPVHPQQRAVLVQLALHRADVRVGEPGPAAEEHRDRIARMDPDDGPGHVFAACWRAHRERGVAGHQPGAALDGVDPLHVGLARPVRAAR